MYRRLVKPGVAFRNSACLLGAVTLLWGCAQSASWHGGPTPYRADVSWNDTRWCVPLRLRTALKQVSERFGPVTVYSSHRWPIENWVKGGKPRSFHLSCKAVDFAVEGDPPGVTEFLVSLPQVGGYSRYASRGFYHIDAGPRRTW